MLTRRTAIMTGIGAALVPVLGRTQDETPIWSLSQSTLTLARRFRPMS
jgi:hypothetical protein